MNIREKLLDVGIHVPDSAHRYHTGKGCLVWLPADAGDGTPALALVPVSRDQYEAMMAAGLAGPRGWDVEAPYVEPSQLSRAAVDIPGDRC